MYRNYFEGIYEGGEVCWCWNDVASDTRAQNTLTNTCLRLHGTEEQRQKYLPRLAQDTLASFALSEAGSGSDAFAMTTTAKQDGGMWREGVIVTWP